MHECKGKEWSYLVQRIIDIFFEAKELKGQTATQLIKKPVMAALRCEYMLIVSGMAKYFVIKIQVNFKSNG